MRRLQRSGLKAPSTWKSAVAKAFADYAVFADAAKQFERLPINSAQRRAGFLAYVKAQGLICFRPGRTGKLEFKKLWRKAKEHVAAMSSGMCAYCEGAVMATDAGQVEHFKPKALFPTLAYDWDNYFLVCGKCNVAKSDNWPKRGGYLRPDEGAPDQELRFERDGTVVAVRRGKAHRTVIDFDLNRTWLVRRRRVNIEKALDGLSDLLKVYAIDASLGEELIGNHLERLSAPETVYSIALRQCLSREFSARRRGP